MTHTCSVAPVSKGLQFLRPLSVLRLMDHPSDDEPASSQPASSSQPDDEEARPCYITPKSSRSRRSTRDNTIITVDEDIMSMVHTMKENQDLKNSVSDVLDVEKNPKKAFILWFSSEVLAILDHMW